MKQKGVCVNFKRGLRKLGGLVYSCRFLMAVFLCASGLFFASDTYATEKISISIPSSVSATLLPFSADGNFASSSATISVTSSYYTGYVLGISAKTANSNALINQSDNTKTLPSITSAVSETNYMNDAYAVANNLNNTWGYKPSTLYNPNTGNNETNNNYLVAPTSTTNQVILAETNAANLTPNTYDITVGARATSETVMGAYENTFVITVVVNQIPYSITYHENTEDSVSGMPANVEGSTLADTVPIGAAPSRSGYMFLGWCDTTTTNDGKADLCSGNVYAAGSDYTVDYTAANNNIDLYAMWGLPTIYDKVSYMNRGKQAANAIKTGVTAASSGVYEYDASVFGAASDMSNDYKIYYYRGILDSNDASYGSGGDGVNYPNYVRLGNTCWRIIRTTGSGGVKMIFNGLYSSGDAANSCANSGSNATAGYTRFASQGASSKAQWYLNINRAGYTFNNDASIQDKTTSTSTTTVFGQTSLNTADSNIKDYIENTWFNSANGVSEYESILEPSAGYCNDRTVYNVSHNSISAVIPYDESTASGSTVYFGTYERNYMTNGRPTLSCPRGSVDIYSTTTTVNGVNSTNGGNGQLSKPVALVTFDEAVFSGVGTTSSTSNAKVFLVNGKNATSLSPHRRASKSNSAYVYVGVMGAGAIAGGNAHTSYYVRPVISLKHDTYAASGSGTAVDPWVIDAPNSGE